MRPSRAEVAALERKPSAARRHYPVEARTLFQIVEKVHLVALPRQSRRAIARRPAAFLPLKILPRHHPGGLHFPGVLFTDVWIARHVPIKAQAPPSGN